MLHMSALCRCSCCFGLIKFTRVRTRVLDAATYQNLVHSVIEEVLEYLYCTHVYVRLEYVRWTE
jgi:hypothetical protein